MIVSILIFLIVLSVLIFVHELGHFLAAKACGIYVDRFSIGMPPRIAGVKVGETDYCIGALPIGGFVKMAGQEDAPLDEAEREATYGHVPEDRWFNKKPVWQRFIVILAGPVMNLLLAVILYGILATVGYPVPEFETVAKVGLVDPDYPAASAPLYLDESGTRLEDYQGEPDARGWQTGDIVVSVNGNPVEGYSDIYINAVLGGSDNTHRVILERPQPDGKPLRYLSFLTPVQREGDENPRYGVGAFVAAKVTELMPGMPSQDAGIAAGDVILAADGVTVSYDTFIKKTAEAPEGQPMHLLVERDGKQLAFDLVPQTVGRFAGITLGARDAETKEAAEGAVPVVGTVDDSTDSGFKLGDRITAVDGKPVTLGELREMERTNPGSIFQVTVERPSVLFGLKQKAATLELELPVEPVRAVGVTMAPIPRMVEKTVPASEIIPEAFRRSYKDLAMTFGTLKALVTGTVSAKALGGPVMIFSVTAQAAEEGITWLLRIMAFISINLAVFNLLPLPVLDGGLLVINAVEGIRRKPLSAKVQERFQQVGLLFIISLMLYVTWNDIGRWITNLTP